MQCHGVVADMLVYLVDVRAVTWGEVGREVDLFSGRCHGTINICGIIICRVGVDGIQVWCCDIG